MFCDRVLHPFVCSPIELSKGNAQQSKTIGSITGEVSCIHAEPAPAVVVKDAPTMSSRTTRITSKATKRKCAYDGSVDPPPITTWARASNTGKSQNASVTNNAICSD